MKISSSLHGLGLHNDCGEITVILMSDLIMTAYYFIVFCVFFVSGSPSMS